MLLITDSKSRIKERCNLKTLTDHEYVKLGRIRRIYLLSEQKKGERLMAACFMANIVMINRQFQTIS